MEKRIKQRWNQDNPEEAVKTSPNVRSSLSKLVRLIAECISPKLFQKERTIAECKEEERKFDKINQALRGKVNNSENPTLRKNDRDRKGALFEKHSMDFLTGKQPKEPKKTKEQKASS